MSFIQAGKFPHTEEQKTFIRAAIAGDNIRANCCAGSGKTSTAIEVAANLENLGKFGKKGLYLCFNKANAEEAKEKFPKSVQCRTAHSLAYGKFGRYFRSRIRRVKSIAFAEIAEAKDLKLTSAVLTKNQLLGFALQTVKKYCNSGDMAIDCDHVSKRSILRLVPDIYETDLSIAAAIVEDYADKIWDEMSNFKSKCPVTHDVYLKLFQLSEPKLKFDYIIFDEAQDASGVMLDIVQKQSCQKIFIGDTYQQIYSWRGAVNAMEKLDPSYTNIYLNQAFRYGPAVADIANKILNTYREVESKIRGWDAFADAEITELQEYDAYICRTNAGVIERLLEGVSEGEKITSLTSVKPYIDLFQGVKNLQQGKWVGVPELSGFKTWEAAKAYSKLPEGSDLSATVSIVNKYGEDYLIEHLQRLENIAPEDADIIVTTGHKCKGMEWKRVKLHSDFEFTVKNYPGLSEEELAELPCNDLTDEDANLLYVACTRAQEALDISLVKPLTELYK